MSSNKLTIFNKKGSSAVLTAMIFIAFAICIAGSIGISRKLVVKSECETYGRVWTKAVLSEYDLPLLEDYGIMAYFGNDSDVSEKIENYMDYTFADRLDIDIGGANADLTGYELGDPSNFADAMEKGLLGKTIGDFISGSGRRERSEKRDTDDIGDSDAASYEGGRSIGNKVVLDTLPSGGASDSFDINNLIERAKGIGGTDGIREAIANSGSEVLFIERYFDNAVTYATEKESFFRNEWEYIIKGNPDDDSNLKSVKRTLFLVRNALNLASLYRDPQKVELIISVAEVITPGPLGAATQLLFAEAWAALESKEDMKTLLDGGRAPIIKTPDQWKTGLGAVLDSENVRKNLDEDAEELLNENRKEIYSKKGIYDKLEILRDGLSYDEHLMLMILAMNERVRLLRIMDLVQINMKYRYYRDFNMMEYYIGTRFTIDANGRSYDFEDSY